MSNLLIKDYELKFIQKIIEDNQVFNETKIAQNMFFDPFAKVLFGIIGQNIGRLGEFRPLLHLKDLCSDIVRIERFNSMDYPFKMTEDPQVIVDFLKSFQDNSIMPNTLERHMEDIFIRHSLGNIAHNMYESIESSTVDIRQYLVNAAHKMDNLLYSAEQDVIVKNGEKLTDDFLTYLSNPEAESYIKTGVDIIDRLSGGTPKQALISWVACGRMFFIVIL